MLEVKSNAWVEKYRPHTLNEYVFDKPETKMFFDKVLSTGEVPNLLLSGIQGSGKTTIAKIISDNLVSNDFDFMVINCSDENSIDTMRDKVSSFALTCAMGSKYKIIEMSEADQLSLQAQGVLRHLIEESIDNCRFIFTCNYPTKIIPALHSRLQHIEFKNPDRGKTLIRLATILANEQIGFNPVDINNIVTLYYPDIRKMINVCQQNIQDNKLIMTNYANDSDNDFINVIDKLESASLNDLQQLIGKISPSEFENYYAALYRHERFKTMPEAYVTIANRLSQHSIVGLPEITFLALLIELQTYIKGAN